MKPSFMNKVKVGILGCGAIAPAYLQNVRGVLSTAVDVVACADLYPEAAAKRAAEFGIPRACSVAALLDDPTIELVVNLTPAPAHYATNLALLKAGKHVFAEKPLALSRAEGRELLEVAAQRRLQIAGAADTFLGAGLQLARKLIDDGRIGVPVGAHGVVALNQHRSKTYHQVFRGPLLDMGPYYFTALVALLGPIARVTGEAEVRFTEKIDPKGAGGAETFKPDVASSVSASLAFAGGPVAALLLSCDVAGYYPRLEIHGTEGSLLLNDANFYGGKVTLTRGSEVQHFETAPGFGEKGRGLGLFEMAQALREGRTARANGALMYHVLDAMLGVIDASHAASHVLVSSRVERPAVYAYPDGT